MRGYPGGQSYRPMFLVDFTPQERANCGCERGTNREGAVAYRWCPPHGRGCENPFGDKDVTTIKDLRAYMESSYR